MLAAINGIGVTRFSGGQIVRGNELFTEDLWVENGSIIDPMDRFFSVCHLITNWPNILPLLLNNIVIY